MEADVQSSADVYAHSGGQYEWDSAAPVAVALSHGLPASRVDGSPLACNNASPYLPDLLIAHPAWKLDGKVNTLPLTWQV
jgi:3'(2'), 5'-bisphosphate nucleotidase